MKNSSGKDSARFSLDTMNARRRAALLCASLASTNPSACFCAGHSSAQTLTSMMVQGERGGEIPAEQRGSGEPGGDRGPAEPGKRARRDMAVDGRSAAVRNGGFQCRHLNEIEVVK